MHDVSAWITLPGLALGVALLCALLYPLHRRLQQRHQRQLRLNITQLSLLRELIGGWQRHRGLSNGLLCGDNSLSQDLAAVRLQVDDHLLQATRLSGNQQAAWASLFDHWSRLRDVRNSDPANNLAQHHLIIRNAIFLMEDIASEFDLSQGRSELSYLPCIWHEVIQAAEWAGQARALGTGIAAARHSSAEQRVRLRFLKQKIEQLSRSAFTTLHNHEQCRRFNLMRGEQTVLSFLRCIDQELLNVEQPEIAAKAYFQCATQAIDELLALIDVALRHLQETGRGATTGNSQAKKNPD